MATGAVSAKSLLVPMVYLVNLLSGMMSGALTDALASATMAAVTGIGTEVMADANVNVAAS